MTEQYVLTDLQRMLLARIAYGNEPLAVTTRSPRDAETYKHEHHGRREEAILALRANRLIEQSRSTEPGGLWNWTVTENGQALAEAIQQHARRARVRTCDCCVVLNCVCSVRTACLGDGPHDVGCHGTHD